MVCYKYVFFFSRILEQDKVIKQIKAPNFYIFHLFAEVWMGAMVTEVTVLY